jgi:hypothetical protein
MKQSLTYEQRKEIEQMLLDHAAEQVGKEYRYAYAFGWVFAMVSDEELADLPKRLQNLKMSDPSAKVSL